MKRYRDTIILHAPVADVFAYYTDMRNLPRMTLPDMRMRVLKAELPLRRGSRIRFAIHPAGIPFEVKWDAVVHEYQVNVLFADRQVHGPFEHWEHRHAFRAIDDATTEVIDSIECGAPLGILGRFAEKLFIGAKLEDLFRHRRKVLQHHFGRTGKRGLTDERTPGS